MKINEQMKGYHIFILSVLIFAGCSKVQNVASRDCNIMMCVSVSDVQLSSKSAYEGESPSKDNPLKADLWFSLESGNYSTIVPTDNNIYLPCHTFKTFDSDNIATIYYNEDNTKPLKYPTSGESVYCVGLYPKGVWKYDDGNFIADITGDEDLMIAPEISGKWNAQFGSDETNSPRFQHVLTWLKIVLCATSYEAIETWGEISDVTINGIPKKVVISKDGTTFSNYEKIKLIGTPQPLAITNIDAGELMCAPLVEYTFSIATSDGKTATKTIRPEGGFQAGFQYVVVLYFNTLSDIDGVCTLTPWENQNDNLYLN